MLASARSTDSVSRPCELNSGGELIVNLEFRLIVCFAPLHGHALLGVVVPQQFALVADLAFCSPLEACVELCKLHCRLQQYWFG